MATHSTVLSAQSKMSEHTTVINLIGKKKILFSIFPHPPLKLIPGYNTASKAFQSFLYLLGWIAFAFLKSENGYNLICGFSMHCLSHIKPYSVNYCSYEHFGPSQQTE